ncbi:hypothetical protein L0337_10020 [candidate division KSB1 bacterium]|nr:hypothetical protein [candidate division KSB1 bacterium]
MKTTVYIGTSFDGFIARKDGDIDTKLSKRGLHRRADYYKAARAYWKRYSIVRLSRQ